jgi:hypothetical protein
VAHIYHLKSIIYNENMGGACGTYWGEEETHARFWVQNLKERDNWNALCLDVRIIPK